MTKKTLPKVAVCLAAYNGKYFLPEQLNSILDQSDVVVTVFVSVDQSTDGTEGWFNEQASKDSRIVLLPHGMRFGGAAKNFFRTIRDVDFLKYDYISFADQDDLWFEKKLNQAITTIQKKSVNAYSSNVIAFWEDGKQKVINKAQKQSEFDYMFESAGPGCTFVMTKKLAVELQNFLLANQEMCDRVSLHDWFTYAFARSRGYKWFIDSKPCILYRQHQKNVVGANIGFKAKKERWKKMREGWHRDQALLLASLLGYEEGFPIAALKNYRLWARLILIVNVRKLRRSFRDALALALFFMVASKK